MSQVQKPNDPVRRQIGLEKRVGTLERTKVVRYTQTNLPTPQEVEEGVIVFVTDALPGSQFLGSNGTNWRILDVDISSFVSDKFFHWPQAIAASVWTITHNLGKIPSIFITDTIGETMMGERSDPTANQTVITFSAAVAGDAYLN